VIEEKAFDRRLTGLFMTDAALGIPDGTSVLRMIDRRSAHRRGSHRQPLLRLAGVAVIALALLFSVTPARAMVAQLLPFGWLQRFGTVLATPTPSPRPGSSDKQSGAVPEAHALPRLTLAEAERQAAFPIRQPAFLPGGMAFRWAFVSPDGHAAMLSYGRADAPAAGMGIQIEQGAPAGFYEVPAWAAEAVKVNGRDAVYWDRGADSGLLSWASRDFTYVLQWSGVVLTRADMIRIAESML